ncbi:MAG: GNAT family N-acetyltransferase [Sulfuricellaceae bacterium]|nr:GNAT family N-acetyltransferase [Sulfuricellaceae bacterium]
MPAALAAQPTDTYTQALNAYRRGDFAAARARLEEVAAVTPTHAEARHLLAVLLAREQCYTEAETHFLAAMRNAPQRHDFRCNHALSLHERGDSEQAATLFRNVLESQPAFAPALNGLGGALFKLGDLAGAEQAFRRALQSQPSNAQHHNNLGNVLKERGLPEQALPCYRQALSLQPGYSEAGFNLGVTLKELDRHEEARGCFERVLQLKPDYPQAAEQLEQVAAFWREPIKGKRLVLRPYGEQDAPFLHRCFRDADFMAHYHQFLSTGEPLARLKAALRNAALSLSWRSRAADWVIHRPGEIKHSTEHPIGIINLADLDLHHRRAELLIGIPAGQKRHAGAALEATLLVMDFAFNRARLNKLTSLVYEGNGYAQRNTLELGFKQEGFRPQHLRVAGQGYLGVFENGLTVADFRANQRLARLSRRLLGWDVTEENHE